MAVQPSPAEILAATKSKTAQPARKELPIVSAKWRCSLPDRRTRLGLTIRDVADAVDMTVSGLWKIEGGSDLRVTTAKRLADFFGCSIESMWTPIIVPESEDGP